VAVLADALLKPLLLLLVHQLLLRLVLEVMGVQQIQQVLRLMEIVAVLLL
jgi:hypothetical protein